MSCKEGCNGAPSYDCTQLDKVLDLYGNDEGSLITILQKAQDIYGFLPEEIIEYTADKMNIKPAKVYGVATFYTQFRFSPVGKYLIMLCMGTACHVNGAKAIEDAIGLELGIKDGETTEDGLFTLNNVACIGCCSLAPVMMINGETYGILDGDKVSEVLNKLRAEA
jgi:NADH-quinone oxidoreductase subunit E